MIYKERIIKRIKERSKKESRTDDNIEILKKRFLIFEKDTLPIINKLSAKTNIVKINSNDERPEVIQHRLLNAIKYLI
jgi:adenylate kinase family enzyme